MRNNIETELRAQMRKLSGENFAEWHRNLTEEQLYVYNRMWERDSVKKDKKPTVRVI